MVFSMTILSNECGILFIHMQNATVSVVMLNVMMSVVVPRILTRLYTFIWLSDICTKRHLHE
jgi:hypothetical protein